MNRMLTVPFICLFSVISFWAQETPPKTEPKTQEPKIPDSMPSADQIIDDYVKASGGKAAIEKLTSREAKGTFEVPALGASGNLEAFAKAPNKILTIITIPAFGTIQHGSDGTVAWEENPQVGMRELSGAELEATKRHSDFHRIIHLKDLYPKRTLKGIEKVGNQEAYLVELTPSEGSSEKMYFDTESRLLIRHDLEREGPQGKVTIETRFEDFRDVDGVKLPFVLHQTLPMISWDIKFEQVKHDTTIDDAKFKKP
jgi:zinc protease